MKLLRMAGVKKSIVPKMPKPKPVRSTMGPIFYTVPKRKKRKSLWKF